MIARSTMTTLLGLWMALWATAGETGSVLGTAAFFKKGSGFTGEAKNAIIVFALDGHEKRVNTNQQGDFGAELPVGTWRLTTVLDASGQKMTIHRDQVRQVVISPNRTTRFDVMLQEPKMVAPDKAQEKRSRRE